MLFQSKHNTFTKIYQLLGHKVRMSKLKKKKKEQTTTEHIP